MGRRGEDLALAIGLGNFGLGIDGVLSIGADAAVATPMAYSYLTILAGFTIDQDQHLVRVSEDCIVETGAAITEKAPSGSGSSGGAISTLHTYGPGAAGGNGQTGAGLAGTARTNSTHDVDAGAGGAGASGVGGGAGATTMLSDSLGRNILESADAWLRGRVSVAQADYQLVGGAGGGGGGGDGTEKGAGGGAGGAVNVLIARTVSNSGTISCDGGDGGDATVGNTGGGGPGAAGTKVVLYREYSGNDPTASPGAVGQGFGTGADGVAAAGNGRAEKYPI